MAQPENMTASSELGEEMPNGSIADWIASVLRGIHRVNNQFRQVQATVTQDGTDIITLIITDVEFTGEDTAVKILLQPSGPMLINLPQEQPLQDDPL